MNNSKGLRMSILFRFGPPSNNEFIMIRNKCEGESVKLTAVPLGSWSDKEYKLLRLTERHQFWGQSMYRYKHLTNVCLSEGGEVVARGRDALNIATDMMRKD